MADTALQFDLTNDINLTTLDDLGSHIIADGFYLAFNIKTTQTTQGKFGFSQNSNFNQLLIGFNGNVNFGNSPGKIQVQFSSNSGNQLVAATSTSTNFNDGNPHTVEIFVALGSTKTVIFVVDGITYGTDYSNRDTINSFIDFVTPFGIGGFIRAGVAQGFIACTVDNIRIGSSPTNLYGEYLLDEGTGTTATDTSGKTNDATLELSSGGYPAWVTGIGQAPYVFTSPATAIVTSQATGNGKVGSDGGFPITERGIVWSTSSNPTTSDSKAIVAGTTGTFQGNMTGLTIYTTYHYRAYAINAKGTSYGPDVTFFTATNKTSMMMGI